MIIWLPKKSLRRRSGSVSRTQVCFYFVACYDYILTLRFIVAVGAMPYLRTDRGQRNQHYQHPPPRGQNYRACFALFGLAHLFRSAWVLFRPRIRRLGSGRGRRTRSTYSPAGWAQRRWTRWQRPIRRTRGSEAVTERL